MTRTAPTLAELTARFLAQPPVAVEPGGEVTPHEVAGGFRAAASELWREAFVALGVTPTAAPGEWATLATADLALGAVPCAAGLFPQRVRSLADVTDLACRRAKPVNGFPGLKSWANRATAGKDMNAALVAAGLLAGLGDEPAARAALEAARALGGETPAYSTQLGACEWLAGNAEAARLAWANAGDHPAARFNLGLAALVAGDVVEAKSHLKPVADRFPAGSGWGHLARLYLALAA